MLLPPDAESVIWLDNQFIPWHKAHLSVTAHHYGIGVFEGLRSYATDEGAVIFRLQDHTKRLFHSAHILNIAIPYTVEQLNQAQCELLKLNHLRDAYLRPFIFYDGLTGISLYTEALQPHAMIIAAGWNAKGYHQNNTIKTIKGLRLKTSSLLRCHPNSVFIKAKANGNYMNAIMALQEARACGADDALLLDQNGHVTEASGANIFMVRNGILYTPELTSALPGITRDTIITLVHDHGLKVYEKPITRDEFYTADEVFLTGTAVEIAPVVEIDWRKISTGNIGPITNKLRDLYANCVQGKMPDKQHWLAPVAHEKLHVA